MRNCITKYVKWLNVSVIVADTITTTTTTDDSPFDCRAIGATTGEVVPSLGSLLEERHLAPLREKRRRGGMSKQVLLYICFVIYLFIEITTKRTN